MEGVGRGWELGLGTPDSVFVLGQNLSLWDLVFLCSQTGISCIHSVHAHKCMHAPVGVHAWKRILTPTYPHIETRASVAKRCVNLVYPASAAEPLTTLISGFCVYGHMA